MKTELALALTTSLIACTSGPSTTPAESAPPEKIKAAKLFESEYGNYFLLLERGSKEKLVFTAVETREGYERSFTFKLPMYARIQGHDCVLAAYFLNEHFPPLLSTPGMHAIEMQPLNESQYSASLDEDEASALTSAGSCTIEYARSMHGKGWTVDFDISDWELVPTRGGSTDSASLETKPRDAIDLVARAFASSPRWGVSPSSLEARANPKGVGVFVHVPQFQVSGYARHPIWFVLADQAMALNSPSKTLTPNLPWPRERPGLSWSDSGFPGAAVSASDFPTN